MHDAQKPRYEAAEPCGPMCCSGLPCGPMCCSLGHSISHLFQQMHAVPDAEAIFCAANRRLLWPLHRQHITYYSSRLATIITDMFASVFCVPGLRAVPHFEERRVDGIVLQNGLRHPLSNAYRACSVVIRLDRQRVGLPRPRQESLRRAQTY